MELLSGVDIPASVRRFSPRENRARTVVYAAVLSSVRSIENSIVLYPYSAGRAQCSDFETDLELGTTEFGQATAADH